MVRISTLLAIGSSLYFACNSVSAANNCIDPNGASTATIAAGKSVGTNSGGAATNACGIAAGTDTAADDTCTFTCDSGYRIRLDDAGASANTQTCTNDGTNDEWANPVGEWCEPLCKLDAAYTHSNTECENANGGCTEKELADGTPACATDHHLTSGGELTASAVGGTSCVAGTDAGGGTFSTPITSGTCEENKCLAKVKADWDAQFCKVSSATATTVPTLGTISHYITGGKYSKCVITCSNEGTTNPDEVAFTVTPGEVLCKLPVDTPHLTADCKSTGAGCTLVQLQASNMNSNCDSTFFNINGAGGATNWASATCSPAGDNTVGTFANIERYACRTTAHPTSKSPTTKSPTTLAPTTKSPVTTAPSVFSSGPRLTGSTVSFAGAVVAGIFMLM